MKKYNLSAKVLEYKDKQTGETKAKYAPIGTLIVTDEGKIYGQIEVQPTNWDGHFNVFEQKKEGGQL